MQEKKEKKEVLLEIEDESDVFARGILDDAQFASEYIDKENTFSADAYYF